MRRYASPSPKSLYLLRHGLDFVDSVTQFVGLAAHAQRRGKKKKGKRKNILFYLEKENYTKENV